MAAPSNAYSIGQLIASLGLDDAEFQRGMAGAQASMNAADAAMKKTSQQLSASMTRIGQKMQKVGKQMTMMVTLPIIAAGTAAVKMQMDFEKSMSKIEGLVGIAREQVQAWKKDILALSPAVGRGPVELADAMFFITSAGIKGAEAMQVLEMSAKASAAGLGETKVVADLVTSAMNAYGKENLSAAMATDILTAAVREGKAEASELSGAMGMVLPITSEMGVGFDQVGAAMAAMTRTGTNARVAATQLKAIMASLLRPTDQANDALKGMKLSAAGLRKQMREEGLIQTLETLRKTTNQYGEDTMGKVFPNIRALMGVLDLMGANAEDNIKIFDSLTNATGALDIAFGAASNTTQFKLDKAISQVKASFTILGTSLKDRLVSIFENLTERIQSLTEWWEKLSDSQKNNILNITGLVAATGPLLVIFGKLFKLIAANPYIALAGAIITLTMGIIGMVRHNRAAVQSIQGVARAEQRVSDAVTEQERRIKSLLIVAKDESLSLQERQRAVDKLNEVLPNYNGYISEETGHLEANNTALGEYLKKLERKLQWTIYEEEYTNALLEQKEAIKELDKLREEALTTTPRNASERANLGIAVAEAQIIVESYIKTLDDLKEKMAEIGIPIPGGEDSREKKTKPPTAMTPIAVTGSPDEMRDILEEINNDTDKMMRDGQANRYQIEKEITDAVKKQAYARFQYEKQLLIKQRAERIQAAQQWVQNTADAVGAIQTLIEAQKQKELSAVGDNATAREAIEKDYYKKQKKWSIAQAIINGALAVTNMLANVPGSAINPATWVGIGIAAASTAAQVAVIAAQSFADGGIVYGETLARVGEYAGASSNPEVIAPLDKLQALIQPVGQGYPQEIRLRAEGRDLVGVINTEHMRQNTY